MVTGVVMEMQFVMVMVVLVLVMVVVMAKVVVVVLMVMGLLLVGPTLWTFSGRLVAWALPMSGQSASWRELLSVLRGHGSVHDHKTVHVRTDPRLQSLTPDTGSSDGMSVASLRMRNECGRG